MEKIICTFNVICVTKGYTSGEPEWHIEETGEATVMERSVAASFPSNKGLEHPLAGLTYQIVRFQREEFLLTCITDGLDGMAVCLMVKPIRGVADWLKLYTDSPTPKGHTSQAVRENAKQTIKNKYKRLRW